MKHFLLFLFLLSIIACQNTTKKYKQVYPDGLTNYNYYSLVHPELLKLINHEFYYTGLDGSEDSLARYIQKNKLKYAKWIEYNDFPDDTTTNTRISKFDQYGNIFYQGDSSNYGSYFKYIFDDNGRIEKRQVYSQTDSLDKEFHFFYNVKNQIEYYIRTIMYNDYIFNEFEIFKDTIYFEYDDRGNMTKADCKVLEYDERNNCIGWNIFGCVVGCGNVQWQWKGEYDENNQLIKSASIDYSSMGYSRYESQDSTFDKTTGLLLQVNFYDGENMDTEIFTYHPTNHKLMECKFYEGSVLKRERFYFYYD